MVGEEEAVAEGVPVLTDHHGCAALRLARARGNADAVGFLANAIEPFAR